MKVGFAYVSKFSPVRIDKTYVYILAGDFFLINIYFQETFSQSDFQKGPELNKQIYKEDKHILIILLI
jgi:hypothetical protein